MSDADPNPLNEDQPEVVEQEETSLLRVLLYPLLLFLVGPAVLVLALKLLLGG